MVLFKWRPSHVRIALFFILCVWTLEFANQECDLETDIRCRCGSSNCKIGHRLVRADRHMCELCSQEVVTSKSTSSSIPQCSGAGRPMAVNANLFAVSKSHSDGNLYVQTFWFCKFLLYEFCCIMLMQPSFIGKMHWQVVIESCYNLHFAGCSAKGCSAQPQCLLDGLVQARLP